VRRRRAEALSNLKRGTPALFLSSFAFGLHVAIKARSYLEILNLAHHSIFCLQFCPGIDMRLSAEPGLGRVKNRTISGFARNSSSALVDAFLYKSSWFTFKRSVKVVFITGKMTLRKYQLQNTNKSNVLTNRITPRLIDRVKFGFM
jgi:hypothetical protein